MICLVYDGSWLGFLTAVFECYEFKFTDVSIVGDSKFQPGLLAKSKEVCTDENKAFRVWKGLKNNLYGDTWKTIYQCYLSELDGIETVLLKFIQQVFSDKDSAKAFGNPVVLKVNQVAKMVYREKHRMEAFVRFKLTKDDIYFAEISPDYNVLPLIANHFEKRYADQRWIIYDIKRKYGIFYDLERAEEIRFAAGHSAELITQDSGVFNEKEELYQTLWKDYFKHVNIAERKNTKLHLQHVPRRYWKYLIEKLP